MQINCRGGVDPEVSAAGPYHVTRSGSWDTLAVHCRAASRLWNPPKLRDYSLGFRVAAVASGK
jgi:formylglycine-generating enzyme required for sulfatase activity